MAVDDTYTKSLLHFNGDNNGTVFTDESGKVWSPVGTVKTSTAQSVFGGASGLFDGTSYISTPDNDEWRLDAGSNANAWTIDFRVYFVGNPNASTMGIVQQYVNDSNFWALYYSSGVDDLYFYVEEGNSPIIELYSAGMSVGTGIWHHIAVVKNGTAGYMFYLNGTAMGAAQTDTSVIPDFAGSVVIGLHRNGGATYYLNGYLDEFRYSQGIARWWGTATFTPPLYQYAPPGGVQAVWFA